MKRFSTPQLRRANKQALDLEGPLILYVNSGDLEVRLWFDVMKKPPSNVLVAISLIDRYVPRMFQYQRKTTNWNAKTVYLSILRRGRDTVASTTVTNDILTLTQNPKKNQIRLGHQTAIPSAPESPEFLCLQRSACKYLSQSTARELKPHTNLLRNSKSSTVGTLSGFSNELLQQAGSYTEENGHRTRGGSLNARETGQRTTWRRVQEDRRGGISAKSRYSWMEKHKIL